MAHKHGEYYGKKGHDAERVTVIQLIRLSLAVLAVFAFLLLGIKLIGSALEPEQSEVYGSLEGRFQPTLSLEHEGKRYVHQEQDYTTILFIGVDQQTWSSTPLGRNGQADFLLLMVIDRKNRQVDTLQIDRDTISTVQVYGAFGNPAGKRDMQICLSYAFGSAPEKSCQNTVKAVSDLLGGIPIDHYIALNMDGISVLNDTLGGVTVTLEEDFSSFDPNMTAGTTIKLHGQQAEHFLRERMLIGDGTNKARMSRQAAFMAAAAELLLEKTASDANFVGQLFEALDGYLVTSCDSVWLMNQVYTVRKYTRTELAWLEGAHAVGRDGFMEFTPDRDALMSYVISTFFEGQ